MEYLQKNIPLIPIMAISTEHSSEIDAAMLAEKTSPQQLLKLKDIVLQVHTTHQKMSEAAHARDKKGNRSARAADQQK